MGIKREPITYKGRSLGIIVLVSAQVFIGVIHLLFGILLLSARTPFFKATIAYDIYTIVFALAVLVFTVLIWRGEKAGWIGTVAVSLFVIVADVLAVLNLPSILGIPTFAAPTEIIYGLIVIAYLAQTKVRKKFLS